MSLSSQTNKVSGVLNIPDSLKSKSQIDSFISLFKDYLIKSSKEFYYIIHDRDINDSGEFKTFHVHFLFDSTGISDRKRLSTHLSNMADYLGCSTNLISVSIWKDYEGLIQYLIHKNSPDKVRYHSSEIVSNMSSEYIKTILERQLDELITIEYLEQLTYECKSLTQIYLKLGLKNSKLYRPIINDLWKDKFKMEQ